MEVGREAIWDEGNWSNDELTRQSSMQLHCEATGCTNLMFLVCTHVLCFFVDMAVSVPLLRFLSIRLLFLECAFFFVHTVVIAF
jgi:hypothetical protein